MGIFNGYLICSDLDGTFDRENERNLKALEYYKQNGGLFTFCTGRSLLNAYEFGLEKFVNAPICLCNGAYIYDFGKKEVIFEKRIPFRARNIAEPLADWLPKIRYIYMPTSGLGYIYTEHLTDEILDLTPLKMVWLFKTVEDADVFLAEARQKISGVYASKSYPFGVEFTNAQATKGSAIQFIKEYTGAKVAIGVGDYGNDSPLLKGADIAVAVDNAIPEIKAVANHIVCNHKDGAIADIIEMIEKGTI